MDLLLVLLLVGPAATLALWFVGVAAALPDPATQGVRITRDDSVSR